MAKCKFCGKELVKSSEKARYETLIDHVSDPNGEPPLRPIWVCVCEQSKDYFFDMFGDEYSR